MRGLLAGVAIGLAVIAAVVLGGYLWLDHRAAAVLGQRFDVPLAEIPIPSDSASLAEGERQAWMYGCHSCHDASLRGKVMIDDPRSMRVVAPNVPASIAAYSDAELARLLRHGVRRDGTGVLVMPVRPFYDLGDADVARIIAHLRTVPVVPAPLPPSELHLLARVAVLNGQLAPEAASIDHGAPRLGTQPDTTPAWRGEYLARTMCGECHGATLLGQLEAPPLLRAMGYSPAQFVSLMLDGRSRDGRDLKTMGPTARERFVRLRRDEIGAIYDYLKTMPATAPAGRGAAEER